MHDQLELAAEYEPLQSARKICCGEIRQDQPVTPWIQRDQRKQGDQPPLRIQPAIPLPMPRRQGCDIVHGLRLQEGCGAITEHLHDLPSGQAETPRKARLACLSWPRHLNSTHRMIGKFPHTADVGDAASTPQPAATPGVADTAEHREAASQPAAREIGGRDGPDPTRYGDWEKNGRCIDF